MLSVEQLQRVYLAARKLRCREWPPEGLGTDGTRRGAEESGNNSPVELHPELIMGDKVDMSFFWPMAYWGVGPMLNCGECREPGKRDGVGRHGARPNVDLKAVRTGIGAELRTLHSDVLREEVPDRMAELLKQLDQPRERPALLVRTPTTPLPQTPPSGGRFLSGPP